MQLSHNEVNDCDPMTKQVKSEKVPDLLVRVRDCLDNGAYRFSQHAVERRKERSISLPDIIEVLHNGYHEKNKDSWDIVFKSWNYAIRGKTVDQNECRVIVSFEDTGLLIITVINLN
jgi:hypothetical protein